MSVTSYFTNNPKSKRHLWLVSLTYPTSPLLGAGMIAATGNVHMAWLPLLMFYVAIPILDMLIGNDKHDLLGQMEDEVSLSSFYKYMVHGLLPIIYFTWLMGAWFIVNYDLPWTSYIALGIAHGWGLAFAINSGHEVGHKTDKFSKWMALLMLAPSFYGHFRVEHNMGHHSDVATPRDSATARFGEGFWAFMAREYPGAWKRAWRLESKRAARKGYSKWSPKNEVVASVIIQTLLYGAVILWLGAAVIPYLVLAWLFSSMALSLQNYVAHYGLLREKRPDGKYLPCQPHHSWNCNLIITNIVSYNLARHSDHHAHPSRHYQHLRKFEDAPQMPMGYMPMFILAYFPPLFRKVMDPKVIANVGGDMSKILTKELAAKDQTA